MGILYDKVLKMRENGRSLQPKDTIQKTNIEMQKEIVKDKAPIKKVIESKPKETVVSKNDNRTGGKS
ncbi:MAG: hypothetical protein J6J23_00190 [Clostridia bacterium]|nr:hypothetical protein [Clostridia bacterium]